MLYSVKKIKKTDDWRMYREMVLEVPYTSFTLLPEWLEGYCLIPGFIKKIGYLILNENGEIIGGIAGIRYWLGKWITVFPSDPAIKQEVETNKTNLLQILKIILATTKGKIHISTGIENPELLGLKKGRFPRGIYPNPGIGLISIQENENTQLETFKYQVRRNIKRSLEQNIEIIEVTKTTELISIYKLLYINSKENKYKIRPFLAMFVFWLNGFKLQTFKFYFAVKNGTRIGCIWTITSGKMINNIMGSSLKTKPRLEVGYSLQWSMINKAIKKGLCGYNISIGGPETVEKFKDDFGRQKINLTKQYVGFFN